MQTININGQVFRNAEGGSMSVVNGRVFINGKDCTPDAKEINISITGDVDSVSVDCCNKLTIEGHVNEVKTTSGDIECGNVSGNVKTTSGDIECHNVFGNVSTVSGDIKHRKN